MEINTSVNQYSNHNPKVSIIMNCLNSALYLKEAIDSVYLQSFKDWEIIFWDNNSSDSSWEIAQKYDNRLKTFRSEKTLPLGKVRNLALEKVNGEYIAFLDCDDIWLPQKLSQQVSILEKDLGFDLVYSNCYILNMETGKKRILHSNRQPQGLIFKYLLGKIINYPIFLVTVILRRQKLLELNTLFDENLNFSEEFDVFMRLLYRSKAAYIHEPLAIRREHKDMSTKTIPIESKINEIRYVFKKLYNLNKDFEKIYAKELKLAEKDLALSFASERLGNIEGKTIRQYLKPFIYISIKAFIFYILSFLPNSILLPLLIFIKKIKNR